ncbi:class I SAM-dependent methyltransferase [Mycobacterium sp. WMMD1722]|uniref:class I SAM-dependent methyltransferase n=1 Tax=Mycobacterium sp. WMMD1722 TaxID=3404117 RepID=UPI003BF492CB
MSRVYNAIHRGLRRIVPLRVRAMRSRHRLKEFSRSVGSDSPQAVFEAVYEKRMWGVGPEGERYSSGFGSHHSAVVEPYIASVSRLLESFDTPPDAVDLGCGDFAIGSALRPLCNRYVACDVVTGLLEQNRARFSGSDVEFRLVDIARDDLPPGDIAFVRQVLQHLSNAAISRALEKIRTTYPRLVLTENLPLDPDFEPNIDIATGPDIRLSVQSGVDIEQPPFGIAVSAAEVLCEVVVKGSRFRTTLYTF